MTLQSSATAIRCQEEPVGALRGIRVLDLSRILAGPYLSMLLADLGADVIKVERPEGDDTRSWGPPFAQGEATYFWSANRNKRSVVLDLRAEEDRRCALDLAHTADVIVENFRPGIAESLGLGYESISASNRRVVYCSISAFGNAPQARSLAGYDLLVQAVGGLMSITGTEESGPTKVGVALVDVLAGLHGAVGVLAALRHQEATGHGQRVDITMLGTLLASMANQSSAFLGTGVSPGPSGNAHPSIVPYQTLHAKDGVFALACGNDKQFRATCRALGISELSNDPRYATNASRVANRQDLIEALEQSLAQTCSVDAVQALVQAGVPAGPVNDISAAFADAERLGLEPIIMMDDGERRIPQVASPLQLSETPVKYATAPPVLPRRKVERLAWKAEDY